MLNRILIIDDNPEIKDFIKYCISRNWSGVEVDIYDPVQGLPEATFGWDQYNLVILDYQLELENEDGLDWLKILNTYPNIPPILFMTAYSHEDLVVQAIKLGAEDYLNKDELSAKRLNEHIAQILGEEIQKTENKKIKVDGVTTQEAAPQMEKTMIMDAKDMASLSEETLLFSHKEDTLVEEESV